MKLYEVEKNLKIKDLLFERITDSNSLEELLKQISRGLKNGLEITSTFDDWLENRFKYQFVWLDKDDYIRALVRALWLAPQFAGTDFGQSRQRDMAQVWTDTARGFLGEIALSRFLKDKFNLDTKFDTKRGKIEEFLPSDIKEIRFPDDSWRSPRIRVSIKTTKFNGRWLDVPGAQYQHSDVFILVKVGILRQHFLAFLKAISFLKDKLFPLGKDLKELNEKSSLELWEEIPEFESIPSYIAGFIDIRSLNLPIHSIGIRKGGKKPVRLIIFSGIGIFTPENILNHDIIKKIDPAKEAQRIDIDPIINGYTGKKFFAHSGGLNYGHEKWLKITNEI